MHFAQVMPFSLLAMLTICLAPAHTLADSVLSLEDEMRLLEAEIHKILEVPQNCEVAIQCHITGYGNKPCGGFRSYLFYSTLSTDGTRLESLVESYNKIDQKLNQQNNMMGTCEAALPPSLICQNSVCTEVPFSLSPPVEQ
ncbi:MAG: hypothetical protein RBR86_09390 [Pseudobdellovibrionaceae bacterium]|jgi:hypothetical protein|nr:hypothetical protein [Pseudobdellovibrionaceae bacterium]